MGAYIHTLFKFGINLLALATMDLKFVILIIISITWPIYPQASAQYPYAYPQASAQYPYAKSGCKSTCGLYFIPYPFGMGYSYCYADNWFEIECRNTRSGEQRPYLKSINVGVVDISVSKGTVLIRNPVFRGNCGENDDQPVIKLGGGPFVYSEDYNKFIAKGCNNIAFLRSNGSKVSGCVSICNHNDDMNNSGIGSRDCNGRYCCETSLPPNLSEYNATIEGLHGNHQCGSAMIVGSSYVEEYAGHDSKDFFYVAAVLEWEILNNSTLKLPADVYSTCYKTNVTSSQYQHSGQRCYCSLGFHGNPYIAGGCKADPLLLYGKKKSRAKWAIVGVLSSLGSIVLLIVLWWLFKVVKKKIIKKRRERFFKRNGGLLLEQRLSSGEVNVEKIRLFSLKDLEKATDRFNMNRVLGKGGKGTVYKGMLTDGKIVAVKKFKVEGMVEEFINEFVILSQVNHRNVVKLLGCCLETEIPLLVYEFIPNGNLFEYLHEQNEELPMTWDMRLRIATEVAGALFYLHSAASQPIYHRDIKSTNILLDEKYRAKVADFGTSRMISIEATHLTTVVQGTFGYLDPEYFHTSQFTDKSDVYSFGVVLVELLTGQKPISLLRPHEAKSLASYFVLCMEENRLFDIIDERIMKEGEKEYIIKVANLANRCLELNGKKRPTMKEVTLELEGVKKLERITRAKENPEEHELERIEDYESWAEYSITSNMGPTLESKSSTLEVMPIISHTR